MQDSEKYKISNATLNKQTSLEALLRVQVQIIQKIISRKKHADWINKTYLYIDLNGGAGKDKNGVMGSPLIFNKILKEYHVTWEGIVYELDYDTYYSLCSSVVSYPLDIRNADHYELLSDKRFDSYDSSEYGLIYSDPSNADVPLEILKHMNQVRPRLDIAINIAAASYKRVRLLKNLGRLTSVLGGIKKHWLIRKPIKNFQWTILFGTNWADFPALSNSDFESIDSPLGGKWWDRIGYTNEERRVEDEIKKSIATIQLKLPMEDNESEL